MSLIKVIQSHNRNKELKKTRQIEEQKLEVMKSNQSNNTKDGISSGLYCNQCGRNIPSDSKFCSYCGHRL